MSKRGRKRKEAEEVIEEAAETGPEVEEEKEAEEVPPEPVAIVEELVELGSLPTATLFELNGVRYRTGEKTPECVVCYSLRYFDEGPLPTDKGWTVDKTVSLGVSTMVKPIK